MADGLKNILILCTGNSARSILGEALVNRLGAGRYRGLSAGSSPAGQVNPYALQLLVKKGFVTDGYHSKSWDKFSGPDAPAIDIVITVCDNAAGEVCPIWPGRPLIAHWGIPDPAAVRGSNDKIRSAFADAFDTLESRIAAFIALDPDQISAEELKAKLGEIGQIA